MRRRQFLAGLTGIAGQGVPGTAKARLNDRPLVLSVGISKYKHVPFLPSAVLDASLIGAAFMALGCKVSMLIDPTRDALLRGLAQFRIDAGSTPLVVIYVAGHGVMADGQNHVFTIDSQRKDAGIPESVLLQAVNNTPRQKLLFLDTCREAPFGATTPAPVSDQFLAGIHVSYATQPGAPALDGQEGHSPYALALQRALNIPGLALPELSQRVRMDVLRATDGAQIPWERSSLLLPVILNPGS